MAYRELRADEVQALQAFARAEGRRWKMELNQVYWYNARVWRDPATDSQEHGYTLHGLRNDLGPNWLQTYRLPKDGDAAKWIKDARCSFPAYSATIAGQVMIVHRQDVGSWAISSKRPGAISEYSIDRFSCSKHEAMKIALAWANHPAKAQATRAMRYGKHVMILVKLGA